METLFRGQTANQLQDLQQGDYNSYESIVKARGKNSGAGAAKRPLALRCGVLPSDRGRVTHSSFRLSRAGLSSLKLLASPIPTSSQGANFGTYVFKLKVAQEEYQGEVRATSQAAAVVPGSDSSLRFAALCDCRAPAGSLLVSAACCCCLTDRCFHPSAFLNAPPPLSTAPSSTL